MAKTDGRRLRAAQTRRRILDAALRLFGERGYGAATMEAIAREAEVAVQTVYFTFGSKPQILKELVDLHVADQQNPLPTLQRPEIVRALATADPREQLRIAAAVSRDIHQRVAPVLDVLRAAAVTSAEAAELWEVNKAQRRAVVRRLVESMAARGSLAGGVSEGRAVDVCYALLGPELYQLVVSERGWTPQEWEEWVHASLCGTLLDPV
jgi:AcrR family transcriptional regulator